MAHGATVVTPDYAVGETSRVEVITPLKLVVIDPPGTDKLRQQERNRSPAIFRFNPDVVDESESALKATLANHRKKFLDALEAVFNQRQISVDKLENARFEQLLKVYQRQNRAFPFLADFARLWATGETDLEIQLDWTAKLRAMQSNYIRGDNLPPAGKVGPMRIVAWNQPELPLDITSALQRGTNMARSNMFTLTRARKELQNSFPPETQSVGKFLTGFIRENCRFEEKLTLEHRTQRVQSIFAADTYQPGQILVASGAVVTARMRAALSELRTRDGSEALQAEIGKQRARADAAFAQLSSLPLPQAGANGSDQFYKWSLFGVIGGLMIWLLIRWMARSPMENSAALTAPGNSPVALAPTAENSTIACPSCSHAITVSVTPKDTIASPGAVRAALLPYFARWLANKTFRKLMWHRVYLMESQRQAEAELRELENRLIQIQAPLEDRLQAYENRVAELEKQLATAKEESHQLIRTQIAMLQKKLEDERAKQPDRN